MMTEAVKFPFNRTARVIVTAILLLFIAACSFNSETARRADFDNNWKFFLGDDSTAKNPGFNDEAWRMLNLPHDWSIEGKFDSLAPEQKAVHCPEVLAGIVKHFQFPPLQKIKTSSLILTVSIV